MTDASRGLLLSDFNIANLAAYLRNDPEPPLVSAHVGPFGQVASVAADGQHPCWQPPPDHVVVWTRPETSISAFANLVRCESVETETALAEVDHYAEMLLQLGQRVPLVFVCTWSADPAERGFGMLDMRPGIGVASTLMRMNLRLADRLAGAPNIYVLDSQRWLAGAGARAWNPKGWYLGKIPFDSQVFKTAAQDIKAALLGIRGRARKLVVVDADDTLWGGVVGDVGWQNLRLGGHDAQGEAFLDFQRRLRSLRTRGVLLGLVSKNEEAVVLEALERHPEMVLRAPDFAAWRINWADKAANIADLAAELKLGLDSVVFLDDHPVERARVREALPEVLVPDLPADKLLVPDVLRGLRCFDAPGLTSEDLTRAESYISERQRTAARATIGSVEDWLQTLEMKVQIEDMCEANLERTAQLLNKTNQMNMATRRLTVSELWSWARSGNRRLWTLRAADRFGDYGLVGIVSIEIRDQVAHVVDFVLSCRVMGRQVEQSMLHLAQTFAVSRDLQRLEARVLPTAKNTPCLRFWQQSGWAQGEDQSFVWTPGDTPTVPHGIEVTSMPALAVTS
jgi:FkbH-like protein